MHTLVRVKSAFFFLLQHLYLPVVLFDNSLENNLSASVSFQINGIKSRSATI